MQATRLINQFKLSINTTVPRPLDYLTINSYPFDVNILSATICRLDPSLNTSVETRQPERWSIQIKNKRITAIDEGGFTLIKSGGKKTEKSVVLIEAKRRLDVCTNQPFVSDERLGQITSEAIAARSSREVDNEREDIFIYMCFFHFIITVDYLEDVNHGRIPTKAAKVTATRWFNLERPLDRKCAVKNVLHLAEYMGQTEGKEDEEEASALPDL
ncbi:uncharacterized protein FFUJ_02234 [Fusarium fujikuroi IMI 58289]|uniref:Uncharacterized protein n=2 Tax=Fusarium fujikuroi TaxID=5127 RepID=S0E272_GIBF5|nr:uncharacterized protein FFUJ_02234 [Fusarium fujikuroi IMI 58289]QGI61455.1 hypothetical protein CEK27_005426 [Fusarium fujikuroi]QGI78641.1 hypothetical protein CEK25_005370 [Fusarium fujikuroi]QGI92353.1 hypothetical protein CEK26_005422 [Fusarium fujikuroi]CCT66768.1 uncharacterized protein FFUJ_02234 [Fusarium fujikuroi IMI 58289]VTT73246.1 unnamed protein product [Fusarium fujikuroi]